MYHVKVAFFFWLIATSHQNITTLQQIYSRNPALDRSETVFLGMDKFCLLQIYCSLPVDKNIFS